MKPNGNGSRRVCTNVTIAYSPDEQQTWLFEGGYPVLAEVAKRKGLPRPFINNQGQIEADDSWWAQMQLTENEKDGSLVK